MTGLMREAALVAACGLLAASTAMAGIPSAANSTIPAGIYVLGSRADVPDPTAAFTVVVRDANNAPVEGSRVEINLIACFDTRLSNQIATVIVNGAAQVLDCQLKTVTAYTDENGSATMSVLGASLNYWTDPDFSKPGAGAGCIQIRADDVLLGTATSIVFDQNGGAQPGGDRVGIEDQNRWLVDFGTGIYKGRSDYNFAVSPGVIGIDDLSAWLYRFGQGTSYEGTSGHGFCN
jgi:hypothetical protein